MKKDNKQVFVLDVSNQLIKEVPRDVLKYTNLKELDLSGNQLTEFPEFLKECKHLEKINISNNQFTRLPDFFREFKNLKELNISYNPLQEIPFGLWKVNGLKNLDISGLDIDEIPVEIGNFEHLEILTINNLKIKSLPDTIGYLKNLKELYLQQNELEKLPKSFSYLANLQKMNLSLNKFQVFPKTIFNFKLLTYVNVSGNRIKVLPKQIGMLKKLTYLNISENKISAIPSTLYVLRTLKKVNFHFNNNLLSDVFIKEVNQKLGKTKSRSQHKKEKKAPQKRPKKAPDDLLETETKSIHNNDAGLFLFRDLGLILLVPLLIYLFFKYNESMDLKIKEDKIKKDKEAYVLAVQNMEASKERVLEKTKEIYVYTNDTASLKLTISANADFSDLEFNKKYTYMYKRKSDYINKFLNNKSYGYKGVIGNGRKQFSQLWLHDSVIPAGYAKKFRVVRYYRMNAKERVYNIERDKKRAYYHREPRGDSVFAINRGIVDFNDLKNQKLKTEIRSFFIPRNIDLTRKENYFYFTSLNANVSKEEFLKAVSYFKTMFIKTKNPDTYCQIKKVKVTKE